MRPSAFHNVSFTFLILVTFFFSEIVFSRCAHLAGELGYVLQPYALSGNDCPSSSGMGKDAADHHGHGDDSANSNGDGCYTPAHSHTSMCGSTVNLPETPGLALQEMVELPSFLPEVFLVPPTEVDPGTLARWERGERELKGDHLRRLEKIIGGSVPG